MSFLMIADCSNCFFALSCFNETMDLIEAIDFIEALLLRSYLKL